MRARMWLGMALLAGAALLLPGAADAGKKPGEDPTEDQINEQKGQDIGDLVLAYKLIELGEKNKAPEALITAAGLFRKMSKVKLTAINEKPEIAVDKDAPEGTKAVDKVEDAPDYEAEANRLFDQAAALAKELKLDLDPLIKIAKSRKVYRAPVGGPRQVSRQIGAKQTHVFKINVVGHQPLHFGFHANIPLRITAVRSDNDNAWAAGVAAQANTTWHPGGKKGGGPVPLTLRIHNLSNQSAHYQFLLN